MASSDDVNTTAVIHDLFGTLKRYSQSHKVSETDILRKRARQYAEADEPTSSGERRPLLVFSAEGTRYAIDVAFVREIREMPSVTRVPGAPPYFSGVINVRGVVVTVFDMVAFLGGGATNTTEEMLLLSNGDMLLSVAVAAV